MKKSLLEIQEQFGLLALSFKRFKILFSILIIFSGFEPPFDSRAFRTSKSFSSRSPGKTPGEFEMEVEGQKITSIGYSASILSTKSTARVQAVQAVSGVCKK